MRADHHCKSRRRRPHCEHWHHQPARDHCVLGQAHWQAACPSDCMAGPSHRRHMRGVEGTGRGTRCSGQNRPVTRSLFLWLQNRLGLGELAAAKGRRRASRGWHGRKLSCISPDGRRPYHRCNQRITHSVDGNWQRRMGRRTYRHVRRTARHIARNNRLCRRSWHDIAGAFWRVHPHCGYGG